MASGVERTFDKTEEFQLVVDEISLLTDRRPLWKELQTLVEVPLHAVPDDLFERENDE